jgi:hypothetical protein
MDELLVILTVSKSLQNGNGVENVTAHWTLTPNGPITRKWLLDWALEKLPERMRESNVLFFSVEPNHLGPSPAPDADGGR